MIVGKLGVLCRLLVFPLFVQLGGFLVRFRGFFVVAGCFMMIVFRHIALGSIPLADHPLRGLKVSIACYLDALGFQIDWQQLSIFASVSRVRCTHFLCGGN